MGGPSALIALWKMMMNKLGRGNRWRREGEEQHLRSEEGDFGHPTTRSKVEESERQFVPRKVHRLERDFN
ncbi:hypothetical protein Sjap_009002 [Stephania japonica]|uniref:Uncharacterized protein n=1 Tax=Stephania japonica TaxID=461633 RepID=A0AAP0JS51_9MAGN